MLEGSSNMHAWKSDVEEAEKEWAREAIDRPGEKPFCLPLPE